MISTRRRDVTPLVRDTLKTTRRNGCEATRPHQFTTAHGLARERVYAGAVARSVPPAAAVTLPADSMGLRRHIGLSIPIAPVVAVGPPATCVDAAGHTLSAPAPHRSLTDPLPDEQQSVVPPIAGESGYYRSPGASRLRQRGSSRSIRVNAVRTTRVVKQVAARGESPTMHPHF